MARYIFTDIFFQFYVNFTTIVSHNTAKEKLQCNVHLLMQKYKIVAYVPILGSNILISRFSFFIVSLDQQQNPAHFNNHVGF